MWQILGAIRSEFNKYGEIVERLRRQLNSAVGTIDTLGTRARTMNRKLRDVEVLPDAAAQKLLGLDQVQIAEPSSEHNSDEVSGPDRRPDVSHPDIVSETESEDEANENSEEPWWKQGA